LWVTHDLLVGSLPGLLADLSCIVTGTCMLVKHAQGKGYKTAEIFMSSSVPVPKSGAPPQWRSSMRNDRTRLFDHSNSEWLQISLGERFKIRTSTKDTGGAYTVLEFVADAGYGAPMHVHDNADEHFIVLEGSVRIANGDKILDAPAGTTVTVSKGTPHAWCNLSDTPVQVLVVLSPGDVEGLFKEVVARKGNDIAAILNKYGCRFVGPPLLESVHTFESSPS